MLRKEKAREIKTALRRQRAVSGRDVLYEEALGKSMGEMKVRASGDVGLFQTQGQQVPRLSRTWG